MPNEFQFDIFLSHRAKAKAVVRPLAERSLRSQAVFMGGSEPESALQSERAATLRRGGDAHSVARTKHAGNGVTSP